jgi:predicted DNA-binding protein
MAETTPIPVRLEKPLIQRLDNAASKIGSNRAAVIRFCVETWLSHFERKGFAALPVNWEQILAEMDGRTREARVISSGEGAKAARLRTKHIAESVRKGSKVSDV